MRASQLIEELEEMIKEFGDCYMVYRNEEMYGAERVYVEDHHETKYFIIE